jgi:SNF2 family DNA or RNA helicase
MMPLVFSQSKRLYRLDDPTPDQEMLVKAAGFDFSTTSQKWFTENPYMAIGTNLPVSGTDFEYQQLKDRYDASWALEPADGLMVPAGRKLMDFQSGGVAEALDRGGNILIADPPGLGKTVQAIMIANEMFAQKIIVVCPAAVRRNWVKEIRRWTNIKTPQIWLTEGVDDWVNPRANWQILSFNGVTNEQLYKVLERFRYDLLIIDEVHNLKTPDARRTQACFGGGLGLWQDGGLRDLCDMVVGLSGTPMPNRPKEIHTIAKAFDHDSIDNMVRGSFIERFNPEVEYQSGYVENRAARLGELQARLRCNFMIRRRKEDVWKDQPPLTMELVNLQPNAEVKRVLKAESLLGIDPLHLTTEDLASGEISTIRREMGEAKLPLVIKYIDHLLNSGIEKLFVAGWHKSVLRPLTEHYGSKAVLIDGAVSPLVREQRKEKFIRDPKTMLCVGQIISIGTGVDGLQQVCDRLCLIEPDWVPGNNVQVVDRLHRLGQTRPVLAEFLVIEGSFDYRILKAVVNKTGTIHSSIDRDVA